MIDRQASVGHVIPAPQTESARDDVAHNLESRLREQVRRKLPGGARAIVLEIDHAAATITVTGVVGSFYSKQVLYQICRHCLPGFRLIDATTVGERPRKQA
jgi:hypothetical protein